MAKLGFHIVKLWVRFQSIHPYWLLYLKSDCYSFLLYHVFRYRRKVVRQNLLRSFPEKDKRAIKSIERQFYRNFCDLVVEGSKTMCMDSVRDASRVKFTNPEVLTRLYEQQKSVIIASPHSGNWEWLAKLMQEISPHKSMAVYKKLESQVFDELVFYLRTKDCALELMETHDTVRRLEELNGNKNAVLMLGDQSPRGIDTDYWTEFLHQDTCWYKGLEYIAKKFDYAVVFVAMKRQGRGHYEVSFELITDHPKPTEENAIVEQYVRCVERFIEANPDNWLWSHRRWKHQRNKVEVA